MTAPKTPLLTVDCIVFNKKKVLLVKRKNKPFKGQYVLPGGFVDIGETVEHACIRETKEETGVKVTKLKLIGVYSHPKRDPRGHSVTIAFIGKSKNTKPKAGDDAAEAAFLNWRKIKLGFDHKKIISHALKIK
jgi:8-oxo-dGTP diphosphatase